jgi:hypothetical protein
MITEKQSRSPKSPKAIIRPSMSTKAKVSGSLIPNVIIVDAKVTPPLTVSNRRW